MVKVLISIVLFFGLVYADESVQEAQINEKILELNQKLIQVDNELTNNIIYKRYGSYNTYKNISKDMENLEIELRKLQSSKASQSKELQRQISNKIQIKLNELELIEEYKESPIGKLIHPEDIGIVPVVTNPFLIFEAFTYIKKLDDGRKKYEQLPLDIENVLKLIEQKLEIMLAIDDIRSTQSTQENILFLEAVKTDFEMVLDIVTTTSEVYDRRVEQIILEVHNKNICTSSKKHLKSH